MPFSTRSSRQASWLSLIPTVSSPPTINNGGALPPASAAAAKSGRPPRETTVLISSGFSAAAVSAAAAPVEAPKYPRGSSRFRAWSRAASQSVAAVRRRVKKGMSKRNAPVIASRVSSSSVRRSKSRDPIFFLKRYPATKRLRGLNRPLPLPWAKITMPAAPAGTRRSPRRRASLSAMTSVSSHASEPEAVFIFVPPRSLHLDVEMRRLLEIKDLLDPHADFDLLLRIMLLVLQPRQVTVEDRHIFDVLDLAAELVTGVLLRPPDNERHVRIFCQVGKGGLAGPHRQEDRTAGARPDILDDREMRRPLGVRRRQEQMPHLFGHRDGAVDLRLHLYPLLFEGTQYLFPGGIKYRVPNSLRIPYVPDSLPNSLYRIPNSLRILFYLFPDAIRTYAMGEFRLRVFLNIGLDLFPVALVIPNFLAIGANWQKSF